MSEIKITGKKKNQSLTIDEIALALVEDDKKINVWVYLIQSGKKSINDVPSKIKSEVETLLNS